MPSFSFVSVNAREKRVHCQNKTNCCFETKRSPCWIFLARTNPTKSSSAICVMGLTASSQNAVDSFVDLCESSTCDLSELEILLAANLHVINAPSSSGKVALVAALDAGNAETVHFLLSDPYTNLRINNCGGDGRTVLMACCAASAPLGASAMSAILEAWGSSLKYTEQDEGNRWSALHYCAYSGCVEQAALLLQAEKSFGPNAQPGLASLLDHYGQSALHIAASRGQVAMLRLLLEQCYSGSEVCAGGVAVRSRDREGFSAVDVADASEDGIADAKAVRDLLLAHEARVAGGGEC